jgi:coenzyme F420-0:L-glutamate ligase/coenzyme F420-1:gamma-L-glutamate ligase
VSVEILALEGVPEVRPGDDLAAMLAGTLETLDVRDGDVVTVTSKIVSKAEGRLIADDDRMGAIAGETVRVVARRGDLVIAETAHGFVCANAGVDASNVDRGRLALLPLDPDASASRLRDAWGAALGVDLAVVITDTFGRAWREGVVNVAIGCAGMAAILDLRGSADHHGRELEATVVALADEVAAASGLVMTKAARVPAAIVRGVPSPRGVPAGTAADLVRAPAEDLFRTSPLQALYDRRAIRSFGEGDVPREALEEAIRAACAAPAPHGSRPWRFTVVTSAAAKKGLLAAAAGGGGEDTPPGAPVLIVPWLSFEAEGRPADPERVHAEQELILLAAGAAIQNLQLALGAQEIASSWAAATLFRQAETRAALGMGDGWFALGVVACGRPSGESDPPEREAVDPARLAEFI